MGEIKIAHMYPDLMNLYGDRGNLICLSQRLKWYGFNCKITPVSLGEDLDFNDIDFIFMGGGSDREQDLIYRDLWKRADRLWIEIEEGMPMLAICGAYQLLGKYYQALDGKIMQGLSFFDFYTEGEEKRLIGNIILEAEVTGEKVTVVGFENHGGRTYLNDSAIEPFGKVIKGYGNNGYDKTEGIFYKNLIGTYLHGPLLPKNPDIADFFIKVILMRKGIKLDKKLDNTIENFAHEQVKKMILAG
ncbi:glutamine amidotransferase [Thermosyntropha sp.]|uniref:type 1 glutamine amidotransferase n=1 Tax=Thermosyntropha sp. TaxID=2740820 RepID=UPI0025DDCAC5|nr:glutamine amidotransferase [Thermosyntropha sp.]MBO8158564.1 glutamine amidotransferase [Thermosyntropha sp.]